MSLISGALAPANRFRGVVVVGILAGALLAGCSNDDAAAEPTDKATSAAAPSSEPNETPSAAPAPEKPAIEPPVRPAEMDGQDAAAAIAAAGYFLGLYTYTYQSGDLTLWQEVSAAECVLCASVETNVEAMVAGGETYEGGEFTWEKEPSAVYMSGTAVHEVVFDARQAEVATFAADGVELARVPESAVLLTVFAYQEDGSWRLSNLGVD